MSTRRSALAGLVVPAAFGAAVVVLVLAGSGDLAAPPVRHLGRWADEVGPVVAAVALLRLAALAAAAWMAVVSTVGASARLVGATQVALAVESALPPWLRRALAGLAGAGAAGAVVLGAAGGATPTAARPPAAVERMVQLPDLPDLPAEPAPTATMVVLGPEAPAASSSTWVVEPGDSFWSIAEELVGDALGRPPTDAEVDPAWRRLVDVNRDRLVSADPDLLLPGQELVLPT